VGAIEAVVFDEVGTDEDVTFPADGEAVPLNEIVGTKDVLFPVNLLVGAKLAFNSEGAVLVLRTEGEGVGMAVAFSDVSDGEILAFTTEGAALPLRIEGEILSRRTDGVNVGRMDAFVAFASVGNNVSFSVDGVNDGLINVGVKDPLKVGIMETLTGAIGKVVTTSVGTIVSLPIEGISVGVPEVAEVGTVVPSAVGRNESDSVGMSE